REDQHEQALGQDRPQGGDGLEVGERPFEAEKAGDPEEGGERAEHEGLRPPAAERAARSEEPRREEREQRRGAAHAAPVMARNTDSSEPSPSTGSRHAAARSSARLPSATRRPRSRMPIRSQSASATWRLWVERKIVTPPAASSTSRRRSAAVPRGSSPAMRSAGTRIWGGGWRVPSRSRRRGPR